MADVTEPVACEACGRRLPSQQGRGRRRRYCDATCRSAARRQRMSMKSREAPGVKNPLTSTRRHVKLDVEPDVGSAGTVALRVGETAKRLARELGGHGESSPLAVMAAARDLAATANEALQEAVDQARAAGHSWREVGDVLGTTRQAAFQRFGHPVDPRTGAPMSREVLPGAHDRAAAIFAWHDQGRWEEILAELDETTRARHDPARLSAAWAAMAGMFGRMERIGEPFARRVGDDTVVDVPLHFEAGDAKGVVRFGLDGKVAGMAIRPASP